ncbi:hypothetical protein HJC23_013335 [Cyclotella cryptica]|uniref:Uncharacterized protein n=1 Tax=Cyclotella cryptica TaxID=29204 RepID=A0ABD3Q0P6_9STRA|eukprot:CCRYP_009750-RA/>CCRYP_009750-RA protein AED:0.29 eAED:0.29 QI:0/-1/0/1/-1/1/1/0/501
MKLSHHVTFLLVRSFFVSARLNSLSLKKHPSQGGIDTKLFTRVRDVTMKDTKAKRVLQVLAGVFGAGNGTSSLDGLSSGVGETFNNTGLGGGAAGLFNGTQALSGGLSNITDNVILNGTGDAANELLDVLFGENVTDIIAGLWNSTMDNGTDMFGDLSGALGPFGGFNGTESDFLGFSNGTEVLGGMFNSSSGVFEFPNVTDIFGGLLNGSSGFFGFPNGTDIFGGLFNDSNGFFGLPNGTFIFEEIFNGTSNATDIFAGFFNGTGDVTSEILESLLGENVTDIMGLPDELEDFFGGYNGTDMMSCPETCPAEVCDIFTSEDGPDLAVLGDACEAGTITECAGMYASLCEFVCNDDVSDGSASAFFDFNASEVGDICSMCSFLDCCDGSNTFQTCVILLPADALPDGVPIAGETSGAVNENSTSEIAVDEDAELVDATENEAANEDSTSDGSTSSEITVETPADMSTTDAARESVDTSHAPMILISRCVSIVSLVVLLIEL